MTFLSSQVCSFLIKINIVITAEDNTTIYGKICSFQIAADNYRGYLIANLAGIQASYFHNRLK